MCACVIEQVKGQSKPNTPLFLPFASFASLALSRQPPTHSPTHTMTAPTKKLSPAKTVYALASRLSRADATLVAAATAAAVDSCATSAGLRKERPQDRST